MNTKFMDTKHEFAKEIMKIHSPSMAKVCLDMMKNIPDYFWVIPASAGKNRPECDLGKGGLVRHSIMVATIADELITSGAFVIEDTPFSHDTARIAALFHDVLKYGIPDDDEGDDDYSKRTDSNRHALSSKWVMDNMRDKVDTKSIISICDIIEFNRCQWKFREYSDNKVHWSGLPIQELVHTADFIASKKWIGGLW